MCLIIFGLHLDIYLGSISGWVTALTAIYSAFSVFHKSYKIKASFGINMSQRLFDEIDINFINNGKMNYIVEFEGLIPSTKCISYDYKIFKRKRIRNVVNQIRYDKDDSNYNESYVKYYNKIKAISPHATLSYNIVVPLADIIKIIKINSNWKHIIENELIYKRELTFVIVFNDYKRRPILGVIKINPKKDLFHKNTYNFMISKMFDYKTLENIILRQNKQIDKEDSIVKNEIQHSIRQMKIFP